MDMQAKGRYLAFLTFTFTLCFILLMATVLLFKSKITIADYKEVIIVLGLPTIIGMAFNSFFHTNPKPEDDSNAKTISDIKSVASNPDAGKSGQPDPGAA